MNQRYDLPDPVILLQRANRWRMAFFSIIILMAGIAIGISGQFMWDRHQLLKKQATTKQSPNTKGKKPTIPNQKAPYLVLGKNLDKHLGLSDEQYNSLLPVLRYHLNQLNKIKAEARPKIREQLSTLDEKVLALLNEQQKTKWRQDFRKLQQQFQLDFRPTSKASTNKTSINSDTNHKEPTDKPKASPSNKSPAKSSAEKKPTPPKKLAETLSP